MLNFDPAACASSPGPPQGDRLPSDHPVAFLTLELELMDPEVVAELCRHPRGPERQEFARAALRLGVLALRQARGTLDADLVQNKMEGLLERLEDLVGGALTQERDRILREFSLDEPSSALHRMVREMATTNGGLRDELRDDLEEVQREFSLDNDQGALSRLRREVTTIVRELASDHERFHHEVRSTLEQMRVRRDEASRSTRHGLEFEEVLGDFLAAECRGHDDVFEACGLKTGRVPRSKKGDFVVTLGRESAAAGARLVIEAKEHRGYNVASALDEIEIARRNRDAGVGLFVFSKSTAPRGLEALARHGQDVLVIWDQDDPATDVILRAALSLARALAVRQKAPREAPFDPSRVDDAMVRIARRADDLEQVVIWARTIEHNGLKIRTRVEAIQAELEEEVTRLARHLEGASKTSVEG